jgi:tripartite-type tricarboxylate transporter receptor subunit TctC
MPLSRRDALKSAGASFAVLTVPRAFAQAAYPSTYIKVIIPSAAGGGHDTMMRIIGEKLAAAWGQLLIVESKAGAAGAIAASTVSKAPADGYTLLVNYSALLSNTVLTPNPGYKLDDFVPVSLLVLTPIAIGVRSSLGVKTLAEFVALAKSRPGKLTYGSYGQGSGGQIDAAITSVGAVSRHPDKIVPLAISSPQRFVRYPDVPTFAETGYPAVNMPGWGGLFAPAATPQPIVDKLAAEMTRILALPDVVP